MEYNVLMSRQEDYALEHFEEEDKFATPFSALEFYTGGDLNQKQYEGIVGLLERLSPGSSIPFFRLQALLQTLGPPEEFTDTFGEDLRCELQALMQHTAERLVEMNHEDIEMFLDDKKVDTADLTLFSTWSFDRAVEYDRYQSSSWGYVNDSEISTYTVTPVRMIVNNDKTVWINAMPQSMRFCRPIWMIRGFKDINTVQETKPEIDKEVANLKRIRVSLPDGRMVHVSFNMVLSVTEEIALKYIPDASKTSNCLICGAPPDAMNKVEILAVDSKDHTVPYYSFTPLYIWIRFFEFLMEISFRLNLGQWKITFDTRYQYEQRKHTIMEQIYEKFDDPENPKRRSGEVCQRGFENPAELSNLLGIDEELIVRFRNIAIAFNVRDPINPHRLDKYCKDTYRHYLNLYAWCRIPSTIHQVLAHGVEIYYHAPPPLAYLAEEMAEPLEIELKRRHTHHSHPRNVKTRLKDVFFRAIHFSDPVLSSCWIQRRRPNRFDQGYPKEVMGMLAFHNESHDSADDEHTPMKVLEYDVREIGLRFRKFDD